MPKKLRLVGMYLAEYPWKHLGLRSTLLKKKNLKKYKGTLYVVHVIFMSSQHIQEKENLVNEIVLWLRKYQWMTRKGKVNLYIRTTVLMWYKLPRKDVKKTK